MKLQYLPAARQGIQETRDYLANTLKNTAAAQKFVCNVLRCVSLLKENPYMGTPLNSRFPIETDLRYLVVSKHLVFYKVTTQTVLVVHVIDGRRDYMSVLFDQTES